ncbi:DUF1624 domain-containing protein [Azospirillum halopraeferens]|uniref:DUF1624 domain-containing protein n=1 Tax=Azospirillum halopraeferens TaxID=34010 RepID=UPI0006842DF2|nr:heparan-alpha-glucosaminide N-acetyltransferase [Azospirillum halopraeferens]
MTSLSPAQPAPRGAAAPRVTAIDAARGVAIAAMVIYHLCWDLDHLGFASFDLFGHPAWLAARTAILSSFLLLVGVGLALAGARGVDRRRFLRRLGLLVLAAAAVSAASWMLFPDSPIVFGVLHHIALASVLGLAALRLPTAAVIAAGVLVLALPRLAGPVPAFDAPALRWIGLMSFEPSSNDYVPLIPWFGAVLLGIVLGRLWLRHAPAAAPPPGGAVGALAWAGRYSLPIYLLHQPVLFGTLWLAAALIVPGDPAADAFARSCRTSCETGGTNAAACADFCACAAEDLQRAGLWSAVTQNRLDDARRPLVDAVVAACAAGTPR